jgi:hypothetical protein
VQRFAGKYLRTPAEVAVRHFGHWECRIGYRKLHHFIDKSRASMDINFSGPLIGRGGVFWAPETRSIRRAFIAHNSQFWKHQSAL